MRVSHPNVKSLTYSSDFDDGYGGRLVFDLRKPCTLADHLGPPNDSICETVFVLWNNNRSTVDYQSMVTADSLGTHRETVQLRNFKGPCCIWEAMAWVLNEV